MIKQSMLGRIYTPFNRRPARTERRLLVNGRWVRSAEAQASHQTLAWLRQTAVDSAIVHAYGR